MASGFFAILDDIAALMDDVALASKLATQKTAGILGDDLAVNAEKATGFMSSRELPVLWAITKGSFLNKLIIIPIVFLLNVFFPAAITYILIGGGLYLAFEGMEKIIEFLFHRKKHSPAVEKAMEINAGNSEKSKIRAAIATDFILSIEIVIIALSTVLDKSRGIQIATVVVVAALATIGVYGLVALIVRMDDAGYKLMAGAGKVRFFSALGQLLVKALPIVIKILAVAGTMALLLVSGGIFIHNTGFLRHILPGLPQTIRELLFGASAGLLAFAFITVTKKIVSLVKGARP